MVVGDKVAATTKLHKFFTGCVRRDDPSTGRILLLREIQKQKGGLWVDFFVFFLNLNVFKE